MDSKQLLKVIEKHAQWLVGMHEGERANLSRANLSGADLFEANLRWANLRGADLFEANLSRANLFGADLYGANLRGADLRGANLYGANLIRANLSGANLRGASLRCTCLASYLTPFDWATANKCELRLVGSRLLVLGSRTRSQPVIGGKPYDVDTLYTAPWFSSSNETECHPGLYVAGGPQAEDMLVAFWLDELLVTESKARVPRFHTLSSVEAFEALEVADMDARGSAADKGQ